MPRAPQPDGATAVLRRAPQECVNLTADQSEVSEFLGDPATHDGLPVERFDTHGAMVFLAGNRAYKIKRAVKFPYMDFSTLDRRKWACEREITFNRRTAPQLYLKSLPITREKNGCLAFDGNGEVVEWTVVMRRFDQAGLFDRLAQESSLTEPLMIQLSDIIGQFHALADPVAPESALGGGVEGLRWALEENLEELDERPGLFPPTEVRALSRKLRARLARTRTELDTRLAKGFVRHCHGDLHLRNICLMDGNPTLFDCIEFNDTIACIDILYDLAFLLMDLDHRKLRPLANLVLNRYLQKTGEFSGLETLALFLAARALVRAKVSASAEARQDKEVCREELRREARSYFKEALAYLAPSLPRLIAIGGLSGTGKTTLAHALAPNLGAAPGAVHLRSDVIRKEHWGVDEQDRLSPEAYDPEVSERVYNTIQARSREVLTGGQTAIADAVYARPHERDELEAVARQLGIPFHGIWLSTETDTLIRRVTQRTADASDATEAVVRRQLNYDTGPVTWQCLSAGGTARQLLKAAESALRT